MKIDDNIDIQDPFMYLRAWNIGLAICAIVIVFAFRLSLLIVQYLLAITGLVFAMCILYLLQKTYAALEKVTKELNREEKDALWSETNKSVRLLLWSFVLLVFGICVFKNFEVIIGAFVHTASTVITLGNDLNLLERLG